MDSDADRLSVEVVYARPDIQRLVRLQMPPQSTVRDAIASSGLLDQFNELVMDEIEAGIFSKAASLEHVLSDGDRVEIYRPLLIDPKEARRRRASKGANGAGSDV